MENITSLGEMYINGSFVDLKKMPIMELEKKVEEVSIEQKNIKNSIMNMIENF